jgi:hypothetical protein
VTVVAAAIIGSAVVGAAVSVDSSKRAAKASKKGTTAASRATIESTQMQIDEIARQFDYQQQILLPQVQEQYNAQRAYSDLLGISGPEIGVNQTTGFEPTARSEEIQQQRRDEEIAVYEQYRDEAQEEMDNLELTSTDVGDAMEMQRRRAELQQTISQYDSEIEGVQNRPSDQERIDQSNQERGAQMGRQGSSGLQDPGRFRDEEGAFVDPNLRDFLDTGDTAYRQSVEGNLLAGETWGEDQYADYLAENQIAAGTAEESTMVRRTDEARIAEGAAGTGVYGEQFQESPGYAFAVEEMNRAQDRVGSAGGPNIGGRAMMEASRRAQGLANQEYYNWAGGRERDLGRLGAAEAADIGRGDTAYAGYENQRIQDVMRSDTGYQDYLRRLETDASRLDQAGSQEDRLAAAEIARSDQGYYNYLDALANQAGFGGGPAATAVDASQAAGAATAGAYGSQGRQLSQLYSDEGTSQANIAYAQGAGINNALQSGVQNYITAGAGGVEMFGGP